MKKVAICAAGFAVLIGVCAMAQAARGIGVDMGTLSSLPGGCIGECDINYPCTQCTRNGTDHWVMCTESGVSYIECDNQEDPDDGVPCGNCALIGNGCGIYKDCYGNGCAHNCEGESPCSGCSLVVGSDPCS